MSLPIISYYYYFLHNVETAIFSYFSLSMLNERVMTIIWRCQLYENTMNTIRLPIYKEMPWTLYKIAQILIHTKQRHPLMLYKEAFLNYIKMPF